MKSEANPQAKKGIILSVLLVGCFLSVLNQTLLNVALPDFMVEFAIKPTTVQWLTTGFMLVNGILVPVTAFLMKRFTTRQLFLASMLLLLAGTLLCAAAPGFELLLAGRLVQAAGAGIIMPLLMMVVMVIFPPENRGAAMGMIGLSIIFAPAVGPVLAGFVIQFFSWRWLFIGMLPLVVIVILLSLKYLVNVSETSKAKLDGLSVILSTVSFGSLLYGFSVAGSEGWGSAEVLVFLIVGILLLLLFCKRQLDAEDPMLNIRVFANKLFTVTTILNALVLMMMYADMILLPIYLQSSRGYTVLETGLLLLPGAVVNALMSPLTGRLLDKVGVKPLVFAGLLFTIPAIWGVTDLNDSTSFAYLMMRTVFLRIGLSFLSMPLNAAGLNALPRHLNMHGSAVSNTARQLAGAIGTALVVTIFTSRSSEHAERLTAAGQTWSEAQLKMESSILGSNDAYLFMTALGVLAFVIAIFIPKRRKSEL